MSVIFAVLFVSGGLLAAGAEVAGWVGGRW